ncbi:unnamed protein product [Thelazia callipaeda]|uniref:Solute carrier family 25 member 38 homolog n=1 Tax=Thelazia callipaeda TaxID=103827 RepID=A0A0N5D8E3_THECL|nr:unnamed protein product [Thelazia callipaeda]
MSKKENDVLLSVLFGSISGLLGSFFILIFQHWAISVLLQPLDRLKTLVQQDTNIPVNSFTQIRAVVNSHGIFDLWRGTLPTLLRVVPGVALYFGCLQIGQNITSHLENTYHKNFILGSLSRTVAALLLMPVTVIKTRFESNLYRDAGMKAATKELFRQHGYKGLYRGTVPTLLRDASFSGIYLAFYRKNLDFFCKDNSVHAPSERLISGVSAGICSCVITQPFDLIKTRIQLYPSQSLSRLISEFYHKGSFATLFRGFLFRSLRRTLMAAISWTLFDEVWLRSRASK